MNMRTISGIAALIAVIGMAGVVSAAEYSDQLDEVVLTIFADTIGSSPSGGSYQVMQSQGEWDGNVFTASILNIDIEDAGTLVGSIASADITYILPEPGAKANPQVNLGFSMIAGSTLTHFSAQSSLMPAGVVNPDGKASVGITVSDLFGDGVTLTGDNGNGYSYTTFYNTGASQFAEQVQGVSAGGLGSNNVYDETTWQPIAGNVANISSMIEFTLTPFDTANGTSTFQVTPEPASVLLLVLGAVALRRRG